jgi:hypothetical protein
MFSRASLRGRSYHFVIVVWRAKEAESASVKNTIEMFIRFILGNFTLTFLVLGGTRETAEARQLALRTLDEAKRDALLEFHHQHRCFASKSAIAQLASMAASDSAMSRGMAFMAGIASGALRKASKNRRQPMMFT